MSSRAASGPGSSSRPTGPAWIVVAAVGLYVAGILLVPLFALVRAVAADVAGVAAALTGADALRALADNTQFIVITHNRGTIEAADALYGVTVGDDSVSRVISLRLDEAQAIADTRRTEARAVMAGEAG